MKCNKCSGATRIKTDTTPDGVQYSYHQCVKCGESVVDMNQLHEVAQKYRAIKRYHARLTKWGYSLGLRIPKELAEKYKFSTAREVTLVPEKHGLLIVPE